MFRYDFHCDQSVFHLVLQKFEHTILYAVHVGSLSLSSRHDIVNMDMMRGGCTL